MSATEIVDQIKALEPQVRAKFLALLLEIEAAQKIAPAWITSASITQRTLC
jgi:hypothetical protein